MNDPIRTTAPTSRLIAVTPASESDWQSSITADRLAVPEQSPEWMRAICSTTRSTDVSRSYEFADGRSIVMPLALEPIALGRSIWSPPPAWGIGGFVGSTIDPSMLREVIGDLTSIRASRVSVRIDDRHEQLWQSAVGPKTKQIPRRSHVIEMFDTQDDHFAALAKSARRSVRRAESEGIRLEVDRTGRLIDTHYDLYLASVRRWARHQHEPERLALLRARRRDPVDKLRAMSDALGERFVTCIAYVEERPAASVILLLGATTRDTRGTMDADVAGPHASTALQWRAIKEAYRFGSVRYHMGESGQSAGLATFKEKFAATPVDHHEYRFERLPITATADRARSVVKRAIGFNDT